jgi:thioesterase domain-containing protein
MRTTGSKPPLFCVHGVGGEVLSYTALVAALDPERPFYAFRAPGHDGEDEPLKDIPSQAALYIQELRTFRPEGPYYLAGYSHGGRVAFEMAQQLRAQGQQVAFLGIIDTWPSEDWPRTLAYAGRWLRNLPKWLAHDFAQSSSEANKNRVRRGLRLVNRIARKLTTPFGGTRQERHVADHINISLLPDAIQRSYEANYHAFISYKPEPYDGRATVFRASAQPLLAPLERDHGWGRYVRGGVTVVHVRGNHTTILIPPLVRELTAALERALDEAERLSVAAAPVAGTSAVKSPQPGSRKAASLPALP